MNMGGIIKNSLKYPFTDWKKILIFGFIILISNLSTLYIVDIFFKSYVVLLDLIRVLISFFILGYLFRIIKSSLNNTDELPKYNAWWVMFKDGVRVYIVYFVYLIPVLLMVFVYSLVNFYYTISTPWSLNIFVSYLHDTIVVLLNGTTNIFYTNSGIWFLVAILYLFFTIPIQFMGIANMANNSSKLSAAFNFGEKFDKIIKIGLKNLLIWYLAIIIPFSIISLYPDPHRIINLSLVGYLLIMITAFPYFQMYLFRLVALFYKSK